AKGKPRLALVEVCEHNPPAIMQGTIRRRRFRRRASFLAALVIAVLAGGVLRVAVAAAEEAPAKAPPERTYSRSPFVHRIVLLDEDGAVIRPPKPGEG